MCWSAEISLRFALLDTLFVALLVAKALHHPQGSNNKKNNHATSPQKAAAFVKEYAVLMACVALQEWAQFGIWKRLEAQKEDDHVSSYCEPWDVFLSIVTMVAAEMVPLPFIISSALSSWPRYGTRRHANNKNRTLQWGILSWVLQFGMLIVSVVQSQIYCVKVGAHHHQVWICESAAYHVGGRRLHFIFFWLYVLACMCAVESHCNRMPAGERRRLQVIAFLTGIVSFYLYGDTLEACSIWCWSAFCLGLCLCAQVYGYVDGLLTLFNGMMDRLVGNHSKRLNSLSSSRSGRHGI